MKRNLKAYYDPAHEAKVNSLIPAAVRFTDEVIGKVTTFATCDGKDWDRLFMAKMDKLTVAAGLRVPLETLMKMRKEMGMEEIE